MAIVVTNLHEFGPQAGTCASVLLDEDGNNFLDQGGEAFCEETDIPEYLVTAKAVNWNTPNFQGYRRDEFWTGGNSQQLTVAGYFRFVGGHSTQQAHFLSNGDDIFFSFFNWAGGSSQGAFNIFIGTPDAPSGDAYVCVTAGVDQHGIAVGDWFAFMFSVDVSGGSDPTRTCWVHKVGDSSSTDLLIPPSPLESYSEWWHATRPALDIQFDDSSNGGGYIFGAMPWYVNNFDNHEASNFYFTNEYVDWSDPSNRAKFVNLTNGKPENPGVDGSSITGTAAKIYLANGEETNGGTAGDYTVLNGPLTDALTSPSD